MRKYSLESGRIIEFESEDKSIEELGELCREIIRRDKKRKKAPFDETLIAIDFICGGGCTCSELINDTTASEAKRVRGIVKKYVDDSKNASIPYVVYRKSGRERICCECTRWNKNEIYWRVLRADSITSSDIQYLVDTLKAIGIFDLETL